MIIIIAHIVCFVVLQLQCHHATRKHTTTKYWVSS